MPFNVPHINRDVSRWIAADDARLSDLSAPPSASAARCSPIIACMRSTAPAPRAASPSSGPTKRANAAARRPME
jgi:hypothetical protein